MERTLRGRLARVGEFSASSGPVMAKPIVLPSSAVNLALANSTSATPVSVSPPTSTLPVETPRSDAEILARLSARQRIAFLARKRPGQLLIGVAGVVGSTYIIVRSLFALGPAIAFVLSWQAFAQGNEPAVNDPFISGSARDAMDWYVALLMGAALVGSMLMAAFAKSETKVGFGMDAGKMIIGFLVGFLSGGKSA